VSNLPGSIINNIKLTQCGWDKKILGKSTMNQKGHSHKELMKCLYRSNLELRNYIIKERELNDKVKGLEGELGRYIVKEEIEKEKKGTGLLSNPDITDKFPDLPPIEEGTKAVEKELAKDLLEVENGNDTK